jgi:serine transporter
MSLHVRPHLLRYGFPLLAFAAILHSYFSAFLGARSGLIGLLNHLRHRRREETDPTSHPLEWVTTLIIALPLWLVALADPSILAIIGMLAAPIVALVCYVMPVYVFRRVPRLAIYRDRASALVMVVGLFVMVSYVIGTNI